MPRARKYRHPGPDSWRRTALLRMVLSIIAALGVCAFMITVQGLNDRVFPANAAVVLGNEVYSDGTLSARLQARVDAAFGLYYHGTVKKLIVSGGTGKSGVNEAEAMRDYLIKHGVDPADIVLDPDGVNTRATAKFTAAYAKEQGWERIIAVSQFFHLPRAVMTIKHEGVPVVGSLSAGYFEGRDFFSLLREIPAYFAYWSEIK